MSETQAYTSVVVSRLHLTVGCVLAVAVAVVPRLLDSYPVWVSLLTAALVAGVSIDMSTVRLGVGPDHIVLGSGPAGHMRVVQTADVIEADATELNWAQVFGIGVPFSLRTTRLTVNAGPALTLELNSGEIVRVSTPRPDSAVQIITEGRIHE